MLLKLYGERGIELTGFLGGLVNSTVTVTELAHAARSSGGRLANAAFKGVVLATGAMLVRNGVILAIFFHRSRFARPPFRWPSCWRLTGTIPLWLRSEALDTSTGGVANRTR